MNSWILIRSPTNLRRNWDDFKKKTSMCDWLIRTQLSNSTVSHHNSIERHWKNVRASADHSLCRCYRLHWIRWTNSNRLRHHAQMSCTASMNQWRMQTKVCHNRAPTRRQQSGKTVRSHIQTVFSNRMASFGRETHGNCVRRFQKLENSWTYSIG